MKVLFIAKPFFIEPLGIMYLSSTIKSLGHEIDLILTSENVEERFAEFSPNIIVYSIMTGDQDFYDAINKSLKQKYNFFSIAGGPHPTFFPEMLENSSFDAICIGEGEGAIRQFLENPYPRETPNFWFKTQEGIIKNPPRFLIENLDEIPFPDRDLISKYSEIKNGPIKHFIASRGCPYNCSYCFNASWAKIYEGKGKRIRFRSVDNLIEEIKKVISTSMTKFVYFQDDTFTLDSEWLEEFAEKYPKEIGFPFHCHVRADTLNEAKVRALKKAGCYSVHIAAETGNDELRNQMLNRNMSKEQIINACNLLREAEIKFMLQNMIGLPGGSLKEDLETLELNIACQPDYAWVSIFQPYPGTQLGKYCIEKGFYSGDFSDLGSSFFDSSPLNFSEEYKNQLANLQKLFAVFVEYPELYKLGLLDIMINIPDTPAKKEAYERAYKEFRREGDKRLYGFYL